MDGSARRAVTSRFRTDIEGLRAVAVIGVIAFHFGLTQLHGGFAGVDVFFVISGYLITSHLLSQLAKKNTIAFISFYASRLRRLLPSAILVILVSILAGYYFYSPSEQKLYSNDAFYTSAYLLNIKLLRNAFDYFAPEAAANPYLHFWSLAVEEQFYLFWPLLLILHFKFLSRIPVWLYIGLILAASFISCVVMTFVSQPWAFYALPFRAWEFAVGGTIPFWHQHSSARLKKIIGYLGLALILASYFLLSEEAGFPGWIAVLPVIGCASAIYAGMDPKAAPQLLNLRPLQFIGWLSYPLYLWHWPVIVYASALPYHLTLIDRVGLVGLTIVLALASKMLLENPARHSRWLVARPASTIAFALVLTFVGLLSARSAGHLADMNMDARQKSIAAEAAKNSPAVSMSQNCIAPLATEEPVTCNLGDPTSEKLIVLLGDSHADAWSSALDKAATALRYKLVTVMKASCPFADIPPFSTRLHRRFYECERWREKAISLVSSLEPDLVVLAQFTDSYVDNSLLDARYTRSSTAEFAEGTKRTVGKFSNAGIRTIVLKDVPFMTRSVPVCLSRAHWLGWDPAVCGASRSLALDPSIDAAEKKAVGQIPDALYVDLTDSFCDHDLCFAEKNGLPMFRDAHHITAAYSQSLAVQLQDVLN
jgi:peptidoglycan/LPS O-acetylase OafA/YrhL